MVSDGCKLNGAQLHDTISPERWCVSKEDLIFLRREVLDAIKSGQIHPTHHDAFDPADRTTGPNLYTVNELYIKAVTHAAGDVSWALMRNPQGLGPCDLFITHAWKEGIFELLDKTLNSWPRGRRAAYICVLSNPQNLDISHLIHDPMLSPFALALSSAQDMLVIPNQSCTIYSRLWCVFEAFLAFEKGKTIFEASAPVTSADIFAACRLPLLCWILGVLVGGANALFLGDDINSSSWFNSAVNGPIALIAISSLSVSFLMKPGKSRLRCVSVGAVFCGLHAVLTPFVAFNTTAETVLSWHLDLQWTASKHHFTGTVNDATCSSPDDDASIRALISDQLASVDETVQVLLTSGISTPSLRYLGSQGIDLSFAGFLSEGAGLSFGLTWNVWLLGIWRPGLAHVTSLQDFQFTWAWESIPFLSFWILLPRLPRDARSWAILALMKLTYPLAVIDVVLTSLFTSAKISLAISVCSLLINVLVLVLIIAGPGRICSIPVCGPWLVRVILGVLFRKESSTPSTPSTAVSTVSDDGSAQAKPDAKAEEKTIEPLATIKDAASPQKRASNRGLIKANTEVIVPVGI